MGGITSLLLLLWVGVTVSTVVDLQKRIIEGQTCKEKERLYHVKITDRNGGLVCGGSLISDQWILTAAHCKKTSMKAVLGVHPDETKATVHIIADHVIFKDKDNNQKDRTHDIMLLKLPKPTHFDHIDLPDCTKHPTPTPNTAEVQVAGHGPTATEHVQSKDLQCANFKVVDCSWHNPLQKDHPEAHQYMFCGRSAGVDTCPGDSGGGVVYNGKIYGVHVSSGDIPCTEEAGFMKVCDYMKWIKDTTGIV